MPELIPEYLREEKLKNIYVSILIKHRIRQIILAVGIFTRRIWHIILEVVRYDI